MRNSAKPFLHTGPVTIGRRPFLAGLAGMAGLGAWPAMAQAQFPSKAVRVIVPTAPGSGSDVLSRAVCEKLSQIWQHPVVVDNRAGGAGAIGVDAVSRAPADGHTLLMTSASPITTVPLLYRKLPYDPARSVIPVSKVGYAQSALLLSANTPANNLAELVALAKQKPGQITYGSFGQGSGGHLAVEAFCQAAGIKMVHVPYKGTAPALNDLLGGQISVLLNEPTAAKAAVDAGRLKAVAVNGPRRHVQLPNVPTFTELGYPSVEGTYPTFAIMAPFGTPEAIVEKISADARQALAAPDLLARFGPLGYVLGGSTPAELARSIKEDTERWATVIRNIGGLQMD